MKALPEPVPEAAQREVDRVCVEIVGCIRDGRGLKQGEKMRGYHSRIARSAGLSSQQLTHRLTGANELEAWLVLHIAREMNAPPGWPLVHWNHAVAAFGRYRESAG